jgi:hypothetical protein
MGRRDRVQHQINHVSHICFIYELENLDAARQQFSDAFGITDWDGPTELSFFGVLQTQSLSTGIEILAPLHDKGPFNDYLKARGEGFFAVIFGVADLETAVRKAQERGIEAVLDADGRPLLIDALTIAAGEPAHLSWRDRVRVYRETPLQPVAGVNAYLGQIEPIH